MRLSAPAQNHKCCEYVPKSSTMIVNNVHNFAWSGWYFGHLAAFVATSSYVSLHMRISVYLGGSGKKILTLAFDSLTLIFLQMAKFRRFEGTFSWFFIELETFCGTWYLPRATAQWPNCSYNKGYIAYFYCACAKRPHFHFRSKIRRHHRIPRPRFPVRRENFGDCGHK